MIAKSLFSDLDKAVWLFHRTAFLKEQPDNEISNTKTSAINTVRDGKFKQITHYHWIM